MFDADLGKKLLWFKNKLFKKEKRKKHLGKAIGLLLAVRRQSVKSGRRSMETNAKTNLDKFE